MKYWAQYIDQYSLVINGDTGDSCRETATHAVATGDPIGLYNCYTPQGWVRHPHPTADWHKDPNEFSRDQWTALMAYFIKYFNSTTTIKYLPLTWKLQKLFRAQNNDPIFYEYVFYMRAFRLWYLFPIIVILDLGLLINVLIRVVKSYFDKDQKTIADDINIVTLCDVFKFNYPTVFSWLSCKLYKLFKGGVFSSWQRYYERDEAPPMDILWEFDIKDL